MATTILQTRNEVEKFLVKLGFKRQQSRKLKLMIAEEVSVTEPFNEPFHLEKIGKHLRNDGWNVIYRTPEVVRYFKRFGAKTFSIVLTAHKEFYFDSLFRRANHCIDCEIFIGRYARGTI